MSLSTKGLAIGVIIGLVVGLSLGYILSPKVDTTQLEKRISELEGQVNSLNGKTNTLETTLTGSTVPKTMFFDIFMKIDSIPGASTEDKHKEWIEIDSFSWGVGRGGSLTADATTLKDFIIYKTLDRSSPKLYEACCSGKLIQEVILELCQNGTTVMKYTLEDVMISSVGSMPLEGISLNAVPIEQISLNYQKIKWEYTPIGQPGETVTAGWDLQQNKPT